MTVEPAQALLVVDVQRAHVTGDRPVPGHGTVLRAARLMADRARRAGALVVHVQNDGPPGAADQWGTDGWRLVLDVLEGDALVSKQEDDAFAAGLGEVIARRGVSSLAICGVQSEMCVAATARGALARGVRVVLPHDAHATYDVPPLDGVPDSSVAAREVVRVAEWSLGDTVEIVTRADEVRFVGPPGEHHTLSGG